MDPLGSPQHLLLGITGTEGTTLANEWSGVGSGGTSRSACVTATRYHSLAAVATTIPDVLEATAHTHSGVIMGLQHKTAPLCSVQSHPESVPTEGGHQMLGNWRESLGLGRCGEDFDTEPADPRRGRGLER